MKKNSEDLRYPYTYAFDSLRYQTTASISRGEMSQIVTTFCNSMSLNKEDVCNKIADEYLKNIDTN